MALPIKESAFTRFIFIFTLSLVVTVLLTFFPLGALAAPGGNGNGNGTPGGGSGGGGGGGGNDDPSGSTAVTIAFDSQNSATVNEGATFSNLTVVITTGTLASNQRVRLRTVNSSQAEEGIDFSIPTVEQTFPAGATAGDSVTFSILTVPDSAEENDEIAEFRLQLPGNGADIGSPNRFYLTILDPEAPVGPVCGNNSCESGETATSCPADCTVCGDSLCTGDETASSCAADCSVCGDNLCSGSEDYLTCPADCEAPAECGNNICESGETLASCPADCSVCGDNLCSGLEDYTTCPADCEAPAECGNDTCESGETLASCPADCSVCGDSLCSGSEDHTSCPADCEAPAECGNDTCESGETLASCPADCSVCGDLQCTGSENISTCAVDCSVCGDNQCSGSETALNCASDCTQCGDGFCTGNEDSSTCSADCGSSTGGFDVQINGSSASSGASLHLGSAPVGSTGSSALISIVNGTAEPVSLSPITLFGDTTDFEVIYGDSSFAATSTAELPVVPYPYTTEEITTTDGNESHPRDTGLKHRPVLSEQLAQAVKQAGAALMDVPIPGQTSIRFAIERVELPFAEDMKITVGGLDKTSETRALLNREVKLYKGKSDLQDQFFYMESKELRVGKIWDRHGNMYGLNNGKITELSSKPAYIFEWLAQEEVSLAEINTATAEIAENYAEATSSLDEPQTGEMSINWNLAEARLAIETDYQLVQLFGGDVNTAAAYVAGLIGAASVMYERDIQTKLVISYLGLHDNSNDGWTSQDAGGNTSDLLAEFRTAWAPTAGGSWPADADIAHFISGATLGGGIAYVNVLCNQNFAFGVSGNIGGDIDWNTFDGTPSNFNWDFIVVTHELGHNFGAHHSHDYCPPLDACFSNFNGCQVPTACETGTVMSYCHLCGGTSNIDLRFHPHVANSMRQNVANSCIGDSEIGAGGTAEVSVRFRPTTDIGLRSVTTTFSHSSTEEVSPFSSSFVGLAE